MRRVIRGTQSGEIVTQKGEQKWNNNQYEKKNTTFLLKMTNLLQIECTFWNLIVIIAVINICWMREYLWKFFLKVRCWWWSANSSGRCYLLSVRHSTRVLAEFMRPCILEFNCNEMNTTNLIGRLSLGVTRVLESPQCLGLSEYPHFISFSVENKASFPKLPILSPLQLESQSSHSLVLWCPVRPYPSFTFPFCYYLITYSFSKLFHPPIYQHLLLKTTWNKSSNSISAPILGW